MERPVVIKFRCPNGHPVAAPDSRIGKTGQCPRCQALFVVPAADHASGESLTPITAERVEVDSKSPSSGPAPASDTFMFLCPNGHKLYGTPNLQGRPGQCPHCNSRFVIPDVGAAADPDTDRHAAAGALFASLDDAEIAWDSLAAADLRHAEAGRQSADDRDEPPPPPLPVSCHPLELIIRRIRAGARGADRLELRLHDGAVLVAEAFSAELSQHEYGVFAVRGDNEAVSVVVIPWDQITRVTLPGLSSLPADLSGTVRPSRSRPDRLP